MKFNIHHLAAALLLSAIHCQLSTALAQGSLTPPPGAPAPTMKTLDQIEARMPISSAPFTITVPGSYYLTTNLTVSAGDAITIAASGVTLDLSGFTIASTDPSTTGTGILLNSGLRNLAILNGFIQGGVTNNGGVYTGSGFGSGIFGFPQTLRVSGVSVSGCLYLGIYLGNGDSTVVESCIVRTVGGDGIVAATIKSSVAKDCGGSAIYGFQVADCRGESTGGGIGLSATTALNCCGFSSSGDGLDATAAQNCYGLSSSLGSGLYAETAQNCKGSSSSGTGLYANTANNCQGASSSGTGLQAYTAYNCIGQSNGSGSGVYADYVAVGCYGSSVSGYGVRGDLVNNCYGKSTSNTGVSAPRIAIGSYGTSTSGTGLMTIMANSCSGSTISVFFPYDM